MKRIRFCTFKCVVKKMFEAHECDVFENWLVPGESSLAYVLDTMEILHRYVYRSKVICIFFRFGKFTLLVF